MIQITPQMRVLVAIERVDGRKGIDSLMRLCQEKLAEDPFSGCVFVFRSRSGTTIRLLNYDGQGYWLAQKRLSRGKFVWWPEGSGAAKPLEAYEAQLLGQWVNRRICQSVLLVRSAFVALTANAPLLTSTPAMEACATLAVLKT
jgi:transposase